MLTLGIDDSGRGPVIGPMILVGVLIDGELEKEFKKLGVKDSKVLSPKKREILASIIRKKALSYHICIIQPTEIDGKTNAGINLNRIEAIKAGEIINKINKGLDKIRVVVDCPSPNTKKWKSQLLNYIEKKENLEIICEHKADKNYVAVSAASIIAKSTREKEIRKIKKKLGIEFGSGYSSDPKTRKFLADHGKKHDGDGIFRKTWSTWKKAYGERKQKKLIDF